MRTDRRTKMVRVLGVLVLSLLVVPGPLVAESALVHRDQWEHSITIDATKLHLPTWWYVPGITPIIRNFDPDSAETFRTTELPELVLEPGVYRFGTFTFDFPLRVTFDGLLDFFPSLDQCVGGRGTPVLVVHCRQTQPFARQPDYKVGGK